MSITGNLYTGASGLASHADAMNVISDNIANVNTTGFKSSRGNFSDVLGSMIAGKPAGAGSRLSSTQIDFSQGSLIGTGNTTDMAIRGEGFFLASGIIDGVESTFFTRNGAFSIDADGNVVNGQGLRIQGNPTDDAGNLLNTISDLRVSTNSIPPNPTTSMSIVATLDASQAISSQAFDVNSPGATSDFATSITTYDSLGRSHELGVYFKRVAPTGTEAARWDYHILAPADAITPGATGQVELTPAAASITFDTTGNLISNNTTSVTAAWDGAEPATIDLDFGSLADGVGKISTSEMASNATFLTQDGFSSGDMAGLRVDEQGVMSGLFSNGQERVLGQIALSRFPNNDGLEKRGHGLYAATKNSGAPVVGVPQSGGRGSIISGSLEGSNVNLADEFVEMITIQRGFQSNSKTINTADDLLSTVLQIKR